MIKKITLMLAATFCMPFALAQDLDYGEDGFTANFDIDSAHTTDGTNYKISATGEAGPYGRVWLSYEFTDKQSRGDSCLLYTSPSPRDVEESRMPSSA